jgi:hemoglobin
MDDPLLSPLFAELDLGAQVRKQVAFMGWAFGSGQRYTGRDLGEADARLVRERGLGDVHFDAVSSHLEAALRELEIPDELVSDAGHRQRCARSGARRLTGLA